MKRILPLLMLLMILALVSGCTTPTQEPLPTSEPVAATDAPPVETATPEPSPSDEPSPEPSSEAAAAQAPETVPTTIPLEGTEETIEVTTFQSKHGYSIQYDVQAFAPESSQDQAQDIFWPTNPDALQGVSLTVKVGTGTDFTLLNAEADLRQALLLERYAIESLEVPETFSAYESMALRATKDNLVMNCYLIAAEGRVYTLQLSYPTEAAEGYGARLWAMAETFAPAKAK